MAKAKKSKKKARASENGLTINIRTLCKEYTDLRISEDVYHELKEYTCDVFIHKFIKIAEKLAKRSKKGTIQEAEYLRAKDYVNYFLMKVEEYEQTE